jgi:hypothetical protein
MGQRKRKPPGRPIVPREGQPDEYDAMAASAATRVKAAIEIGEACFARLCRDFGEPTARLVMKRCHDFAEAPEPTAPPAPMSRQTVVLPSADKIRAMTYRKVCQWWRRIQDNAQVFEGDQRESLKVLATRYADGKGYQGRIPPLPPPLKKKGASRRITPKGAELPAMFDALKLKHPTFSKTRIAEIIAKQRGTTYGKSAEAIERTERTWRKKNRKI